MSRNFTDYATMPLFDSRHVAKLDGLPNDGLQVPRSDHAKVASHQTDGPRMKLGYDTRHKRCLPLPKTGKQFLTILLRLPRKAWRMGSLPSYLPRLTRCPSAPPLRISAFGGV